MIFIHSSSYTRRKHVTDESFVAKSWNIYPTYSIDILRLCSHVRSMVYMSKKSIVFKKTLVDLPAAKFHSWKSRKYWELGINCVGFSSWFLSILMFRLSVGGGRRGDNGCQDRKILVIWCLWNTTKRFITMAPTWCLKISKSKSWLFICSALIGNNCTKAEHGNWLS